MYEKYLDSLPEEIEDIVIEHEAETAYLITRSRFA